MLAVPAAAGLAGRAGFYDERLAMSTENACLIHFCRRTACGILAVCLMAG
jgi:hypothetical protein